LGCFDKTAACQLLDNYCILSSLVVIQEKVTGEEALVTKDAVRVKALMINL
jgi:hypothetical protein